MGWWSTHAGGNTVNIPEGYDETQGLMSDDAWSGAGSGTIVSILKKIAAGGGGSAVTIADGADVAQGTTTDLASGNTVIGLLKNLKAALAGTLTTTTSWASAQHIIVDTAPSTAVTGPLTDTQLRATPVPVSGTVTASGPLTDTQLRASAPVVDTELPAAAALTDADVNPTTPKVGAAGMLWDSTLNAGAGGWFRAPGTVAGGLKVNVGNASLAVTMATQTPDVTDRAARLIGAPTFPTLTKGTQQATGLSVQDLKDSGRNVTNYFMAAMVALTTGEVMQSLTGYKGGAAVGATATPAVVTAGKTYRIERVIISFLAATAIGGALVRLRALAGGVALIGSPLVMNWHVGIPAIFTAGAEMTYTFDYPDGLEFAAGFGIAIGVIGEGADGVTGTAVGKILVSIEGYEY